MTELSRIGTYLCLRGSRRLPRFEVFFDEGYVGFESLLTGLFLRGVGKMHHH
jgi:hypothetical protein